MIYNVLFVAVSHVFYSVPCAIESCQESDCIWKKTFLTQHCWDVRINIDSTAGIQNCLHLQLVATTSFLLMHMSCLEVI